MLRRVKKERVRELAMKYYVTVQPAPFAKTPDGVFPLLRS